MTLKILLTFLLPLIVIGIIFGIGIEFLKQGSTKNKHANSYEQLYDFGAVALGDEIRHNFVIHNNGNNTMRKNKFFADCKCTILSPVPEEIKPGQSVEFVMSVMPYTASDDYSVRAIWQSTDSSRCIFELHGKVIEQYPKECNFGIIRRGGGSKQYVWLKSLPGRRTHLVKVVYDEDQFAVTTPIPFENGNWRIEISLKSSSIPGPIRSNLNLVTDDPKPIKQIVLVGEIRDFVEFDPPIVSFGILRSGLISHRSININLDQDACQGIFIVEQPSNNNFRAMIANKERNSNILIVDYNGNGQSDDTNILNDSILIGFNINNHVEYRKIRLQAMFEQSNNTNKFH